MIVQTSISQYLTAITPLSRFDVQLYGLSCICFMEPQVLYVLGLSSDNLSDKIINATSRENLSSGFATR